MSKRTVTVEGLADLDKALGELIATTSSTTGKGVLRRIGRKALLPFDASWRARAPRDTGELADSGGVGSKLSRRQRKGRSRGSTVEVFAGPGPLAQATQDEFGNSHQAPTPFARPAWDETKDQALEIVASDLGAEILKTAKRAEQRARRLLAKKG